MDHNQLLPFERNRYYVGKLLTSADFQTEQTYGSHKRRFLNEMMFGSGIICGLGVYSLDDLTIMVDSGVAVDGCGRELAVENAVVCKLSSVEGFEELEGDRITLCLGYQEENVHPVYTVRGTESGESYEYNRIREGWKLFVLDSETMPRPVQPELEFLAAATLYADEDYQVSCTMPTQTPCGALVRVDVTVRRLRETAQPLTLKAAIQTPAFFGEDGEHQWDLELRELCPDGEVTLHYLLRAQAAPSPECVLLADSQAIQVWVGEQERQARDNFALRAAIVSATAEQLVDQAVASASLEMRSLSGVDFVPLGEILLQRTRSAYLIEEVRTLGVRQYIRTTASMPVREELERWFRPEAASAPEAMERGNRLQAQERYVEPIYATGLCEIPLDANLRRGQVAYSNEIVHGLGPGTVYVSVGVEYLADDPKLNGVGRSTIYGNTALFPGEQTSAPAAELAVKVMNDRGSFVVAARLLEDSSQVLLPLRWVALVMPGGMEETKLQSLAGKSIAAVQSTVVMATRESHYFNVRFNNMEPCTLTYELTEKDSGTITSDGIYTAPGREGVFEIRIFCTEMPLITTYAYAVVKKRDVQQTEETPQE